MAGTINSLGLGSGVLTADLLDRLKSADTAALVTPIDAKITLNTQKTQAMDLLNSLLSSFQSSVEALDDDTLYQSRSVAGTNDGVAVTAVSGSQIRDFSLNITNIAKKSVIESGTFTSSSALVGSADGTLKIGIAGKEYSIAYTASTTLDSLKQAINDTAGTDVSASILQTGTSAFNLVLTSKTTGQNQAISLTDISALGSLDDKLVTKNVRTGTFATKETAIASGTGDVAITVDGALAVNIPYTASTTLQGLTDSINSNTTLNAKVAASIVEYGTNDFRMILTPKVGNAGVVSFADTGAGLSTAITTGATATTGTSSVIQDSIDAKFTFDGISMTRSTNTISDISNGMTINLLKDSGSANIAITQDRSKITTSMQSMVTSYNSLVKELGNMTAYDVKEGKVGIFNGENTIKNISREISKMITSIDSKGNSLPNYGIELSEEGVMSLDTSIFTTKMDANPGGLEEFFSGKTTVSQIGSTKSGSFATASTLISSGASGTMTINIAGIPTSLAYTGTTTLQQMADAINADSTLSAKVSASVIQNATNDFRLTLTPKGLSVGETITLSDSVGGGLLSALTSTTSTQDISSTTDGAFTLLYKLINSYTSATNGTITNFTKATKDATTILTADKTKATASLTARYDTLTAKFAAYDSLISKLNNQFNSLKQQIDAQAAASSG